MKKTLAKGRIGLVRTYVRTRTRQTENNFRAYVDVVEPETSRMYARRQNRILDVWCGVIDIAIAAIDIALSIAGKDR